MNEKSSPVDAIKNMIGNTDLKETVNKVTNQIKDSIKDVDVSEAVDDIKKSYAHGGIKEAAATTGEKIKEVVDKAGTVISQGLKDYPGAAIDKSDCNDVTAHLVKEDVRSLNNNPRNSDM